MHSQSQRMNISSALNHFSQAFVGRDFVKNIFTWLIVLLIGLNTSDIFAKDKGVKQTDWHYTMRPDDTIQSIARNVLNKKYTWNDLVRHNRIENPKDLLPGSIIKVPMDWLIQQPKPATALSTTGSVLIKRARNVQTKLLKANMPIRVGDEVSTRNGTALIQFADGSLLRLEENSTLMFNKMSHYGNTGMVDTQLRLKKGSLSTDVKPLVKGSRYEIKTPSAVAAVRGTEFRLNVSENGDNTKLEVLEGLVEFSHEHGSTLVSEGQGAEIKRGVARVEKRNLDPAPSPMFADAPIKELPATLSWQERKAAKQFDYEVVDKQQQGKRVLSGSSAEPQVELDHLTNGQYSVAVHAVDSQGFGGMEANSDIQVSVDRDIPELISPMDGSVVDNARPEFSWKYTRQNTRGTLEVSSDPEFENLVISRNVLTASSFKVRSKLEPGVYHWRIVTDVNDEHQGDVNSSMFSLRGKMKPVKILSVNYIDSQVGLFWNSVDEAKAYVLQLSDSMNFETILKEETISKNSAHLRLKEGRTYFARVKGIGNDLYTSDYGPAMELAIK